MYTMKEVCDIVRIPYETLRFYCNKGLVPNITRDKNNYRIFNEKNINWLSSLQCLKKCGMSIKDMKKYMDLCYEGKSSIPKRKEMLNAQMDILLTRIDEMHESVEFIASKQDFYDNVLAGKTKYISNLIDIDEQETT